VSSAAEIILPKTGIMQASMILMPSAGILPFSRSIADQVRVLALGQCRGLTFSQIREVMNQCASLEDLRLHLCCCGRGLGMKAEGRVADDGGICSKTLHDLVLVFCHSVDAAGKSLDGKCWIWPPK